MSNWFCLKAEKMKFYDCNTAPSPRLVRIFIVEKCAELQTIEVDLRNGEHLTPEFCQINPHCTVPVLETDDGMKITSTQGCWRYLEETIPNPPLLGKTPEEKAKISDLIWQIEMDGFQAIAEGLRNSSPRLKNRAITGPDNCAQIPELGKRGKIRAQRFLTQLEELLGEKDYMATNYFTAVDIMALVIVDFAGWLKITLPKTATNARRWYERVSLRPSSLM